MIPGLIIALFLVAIFGRLVILLFVRHSSSQLTTRQRIGIWAKTISLLLVVIFAGLSMLETPYQTAVHILLIASFCAWVISIPWSWGARTSISQSTWSPFQSSEVREICAHLTPTEHAKLIDDARNRELRIGVWFAGPLSIVLATTGFSLYLSWWPGLVLLPLFALYFVFWVGPGFRKMRRHSIEQLCETEWARSHNYTPSSVKLQTFPWSK